jgi:uncharacterized membrane protein YeaQ/YmgE (transglycosylase-associated protein family)
MKCVQFLCHLSIFDLGNIVVGIIGSFIAGWLLPKIGLKSIVKNPIVDQIIFAVIGAVILLIVLGLIPR